MCCYLPGLLAILLLGNGYHKCVVIYQAYWLYSCWVTAITNVLILYEFLLFSRSAIGHTAKIDVLAAVRSGSYSSWQIKSPVQIRPDSPDELAEPKITVMTAMKRAVKKNVDKIAFG